MIFISIGVQEATDDAIEQILAEEEKNGALDVIFDRVDDENEEQDEEEAIDEQFFTDMISNFDLISTCNSSGISQVLIVLLTMYSSELMMR